MAMKKLTTTSTRKCLWHNIETTTPGAYFRRSCGWAGVWVSRLRRLPFILEIRDIWPESIVAVGALGNPRLLRLLEHWERSMYRAATRIVTVGEGYQQQLEARGVDSERIDVVHNGVDRKAFAGAGDGSQVRAEFGLGDAFVVSYVGTIGMGSGRPSSSGVP